LKKKFAYVREKIPVSDIPLFNPPKSLNKEKLVKVFREILKDIEPVFKLPQKSLGKVISISEKISHIKNLILEKATISFGELLKDSRDKTEVIVSFLALLELVKQRTIGITQKDRFSEIKISKV